MPRKVENLKVLKSEISAAKDKSRELQRKLSDLEPEKICSTTSEENLILIGYFLSGIYSSFEEIFTKVAREFENKIEDTTKWHLELLNRMILEIEDIRPAILSKKSKDCLDELRRFRHMFRFSYAFELDWEKILFTVKRWNKNASLVYHDIKKFLDYLDKLSK